MKMMMMMNMKTLCCSPKSHLHVASTPRAMTMTTTSLTFKPHHHLSPLLRSIRSAAMPPPELTPAGRFFRKLSEPILKVLQKLPAFQQTSEPVLKVFQNLPEYTPATLSTLFVVFLLSLAFKLLKGAKKDDSKSTPATATYSVVQVLSNALKIMIKFVASNLWDLFIEILTNDLGEVYPNLSFLEIPLKLLKKNKCLTLLGYLPVPNMYEMVLASPKMQMEAMKHDKWIALMKSKNIAIVILFGLLCIAAGMVVTFLSEWEPASEK